MPCASRACHGDAQRRSEACARAIHVYARRSRLLLVHADTWPSTTRTAAMSASERESLHAGEPPPAPHRRQRPRTLARRERRQQRRGELLAQQPAPVDALEEAGGAHRLCLTGTSRLQRSESVSGAHPALGNATAKASLLLRHVLKRDREEGEHTSSRSSSCATSAAAAEEAEEGSSAGLPCRISLTTRAGAAATLVASAGKGGRPAHCEHAAPREDGGGWTGGGA